MQWLQHLFLIAFAKGLSAVWQAGLCHATMPAVQASASGPNARSACELAQTQGAHVTGLPEGPTVIAWS